MTTAVPDWAAAHPSPLDQRMGIELLELSATKVVARYPVEGNTQPFGLWHGGASAVVVESLASFGAFVHAREQGQAAVGVDLNVTHHRRVKHGWVTGVATPAHVGRTSATWQVQLFDDGERLIASGRLTCRFVNLT